MRKKNILIIFIICFVSTVFSSEKFIFEGLDANYGLEIFKDQNGDNHTFYKMQLNPVFTMGKHKLGLDLNFLVDEDGDIGMGSYEDNDTFLDKIDFYEYGNVNKKTNLRIGFLEEVTLGNGSIVKDYSNKVRYPEENKKMGLYYHRKNKYDDGFQMFINDLDNSKIWGFRGFIVPVDDVTIGASYVIDRDPDVNPLTGDKIEIYGVDFSTPLFRGISKKLLLYEDFTRIKHYGGCFTTGLKYDSGYRAKFRGEYRNYDSDYIPGYFSKYYETEKKNKFVDLNFFASKKDTVKSINIWAYYNLIDIMSVEFEFEEFDKYDIQPTLKINAVLLQSPVDGLSLEWEYFNRDADIRDYLSNKEAKDVYSTTKLVMETKTGTELSISRKRIIDKDGNKEYVTSFSSKLKIK